MAVRISSGIELAMEYGGVKRVTELLADVAYLEQIASRPDGFAILNKARSWIVEAQIFEAEHGAGSKLDQEHWHLKQMAILQETERKQNAWLASIGSGHQSVEQAHLR